MEKSVSLYSELRPEEIHAFLKETVIKNRKSPWIRGGLDDIKPGAYPVEVMQFTNKYGLEKDVLDIVGEEVTGNKPYELYKLAFGLKNCVLIQNNDQQILVVDSHMFALPFLAHQFNIGALLKGANMLHIDDHPDLGTCDLKIANFKNRTDSQTIEDLYNKTSPGTWLYNPLIVPGLIDYTRWQWKHLEGPSQKWKTYRMTNQYGKLETTSDFLLKPTILDIDIDFIRPAEQGSSRILKEKIQELIKIGKNSKCVILAISPAYMNRDRGIEYSKEIVSGLLNKKG